jgi:2-hydroxycyclohexanecarboxyl-CoA dehydrogenase
MMGFAPDLLTGRTALVSGGAGAIGAAVARQLVAIGCRVVVVDTAADRLRETADALSVQGVVADVTTASGVAAAVEAAGERVDILVNGVGDHLASSGPFESSTEDQWRRLIDVNYLSVLRCCHAVLPGMISRGWGRIVNFSSVEGIRAAPHLAVYAGLKRAVDGFTKSLAVDVARHGVLVNSVAVDKVRAFQTGHYAVPDEYEALVPTWIPAGHYADADELARLVVFLASPLNTWVVGQSVVADGGTLSAGGWYRTPRRWTNQPLLVQYFEDPAVNDGRPPMVR